MKSWFSPFKAAFVCAAIVLSTACGQQGGGMPEINGVKGPFFNVVDGKAVITMKFLNIDFDGGIKAPIPETRQSQIEFSPNIIDGGMMLSLYLDTNDLEDLDIGVGDANTLPDGRPVPGIPGGRLENSLRIDTRFDKFDVSFFFHKTLFGLWMPFGFETAGISGYWRVNLNGKNVGFLGIVGNDNEGRKAGGVVMVYLNNLRNKQFRRLIEHSKRNPHLVF